MGGADTALASGASEAPDANSGGACSVGSFEDEIEEFFLGVFEVAPYRVGAQVSQLHHVGELAVHEHRGFDYVVYGRPQRASLQERLHQLGMPARDGLVVVADEQPVACLTVLEVALEAGHHLLERLLVDGCACRQRVEVDLVDALREQAGYAPSRYEPRNSSDGLPSFFQRQVNVGFGVPVVLLSPLAPLAVDLLQPEELAFRFACTSMRRLS